MIRQITRRIIPAGVLFFLYPSLLFAGFFASPREKADDSAREAGFKPVVISTPHFKIYSCQKVTDQASALKIYIEGDGSAWLAKNRLSSDPTPKKRLVLDWALKDKSANVAYLARPCQYLNVAEEKNCDSAYWSTKRFSEEVIASMNEAIDQIKSQTKAAQIELIGYSGGGAVAVLIAARRHDVAFLKTVAGNLDPSAWARHHRISPLAGSLNPMDVAAKISSIPQEHYVGGQDKVMPPFIAYAFVKKAGDPPNIKIIKFPGASHDSGWEDLP